MAIIKKLASQDYVVTKVETEVAEEVTTSLGTAKESGDFKGEKGDKGDTGADGKTPVNGVDYFTPEEIQYIAEQAAGMVDVPEGGGGDATAGIESSDHPGCFYRIVDGETEWWNPPMALGVEYRTTERWKEKVVWTVLIDCGLVKSGKQTISTDFACLAILGRRGFSGGKSLPLMYLGEYHDQWSFTCNAIRSNNKISIEVEGGSLVSNSAPTHIKVWYTKE